MLLHLGRGLAPLRSAFAALKALMSRDGGRLSARNGATLVWR